MKPEILKSNVDFRRTYSRGKYVVGQDLITYCVKSNRNIIRYGITSSKKIGNAVARNRSRRVIRAAFSELNNHINVSCDIVFVARAHTSTVKSQTILTEMKRQLDKLGVYKEI